MHGRRPRLRGPHLHGRRPPLRARARTGLEPGVATPYDVTLDGEKVWPIDDGWPHSVIRTATKGKPVDVVFGSCRTHYPHEPPYTKRKDEHPEGREVCALRALALRLRDRPHDEWPNALFHLGDQIYADEVDPRTLEIIEGEEISNFEEYTLAYKLSWSEPAIRWLMSTVSNAMIWDDHDVIDDWNTSREWLEDIRKQDWWDERIIGAFVSYWIYQHIGNLSPAALAEDAALPARARARRRRGDAARLRLPRRPRPVPGPLELLPRPRLDAADHGRLAGRPDARSRATGRWSTTSSGRGWSRRACDADVDHLLIGTSLPWLLTPGLHHLEAWDEAVAQGAWGKGRGEAARREAAPGARPRALGAPSTARSRS